MSLTQVRHRHTVPSMSHLPDLLTVREVAKVLRVSDETIHRWARDGRIEFIDVCGRKRFDRAYIEGLLGLDDTAEERAS